MCDADIVEVKTTVQKFAESEYLGAPLNTLLHARFPQELAVFLRTAALTEGVSRTGQPQSNAGAITPRLGTGIQTPMGSKNN